MDKLTRLLFLLVLIVHFMFFLLEALLWMQPAVHDVLIGYLNNPVHTDYPTQALVLKHLFVNQGFYNLFLVIGGIAGWYLLNNDNVPAGYALMIFLCFCGVGAGIILACSTTAYILALGQALPAVVTMTRLISLYKKHKTGAIF